MKVKVSKVMAAAIKKEIAAGNYPGIESAQYCEMSADNYRLFVDCFGLNITDYDYNKSVYKAIQVTYPADYYAMPRYITTKDLNQAFKESDKSYIGFFKALYKIIEI